MRKGISLLEAIVSASLLAAVFGMAATILLATQKAIKREGIKREGLILAFSISQNLMTHPFNSLPPQEFEGEGGLVTVQLRFPAKDDESLKVYDEFGNQLEWEMADDKKTLRIEVGRLGKFFVDYEGFWFEDGWEVSVRGEFVDENLKPSGRPTDIKLIRTTVRRGDVYCPPLSFLKVRGK